MGLTRGLGVSVALVALCVSFAALGACGDEAAAPGTSPDGNDSGGSDTEGGPPPTLAEFGLDTRPSNTTCTAVARPPSTAPVAFERIFASAQLSLPTMIAQIPGDDTRWFVSQRGVANGGTASIVSFSVADPSVKTTVATVGPLGAMTSEGGLLGLAFPPNFAQTKRLYVTWVRQGGGTGYQSEVGFFTTTDNGATFSNYQTILGPFEQPFPNHNGGGIAFGKDGLLYLSFGDGGAADDAAHNGQNVNGFFSKILRIDVDHPADGRAYGIPATNPFKAGGGEPATFAMGFRNPFRFSLDRESDELWVGDVGQNNWEEIDAKVKLGGNYGWPCREGFHDYLTSDLTKCPNGTVGQVDPTVEHQHVPSNSRSITGGIVYRGKAVPNFVGTYVYGDYVKQQLWTLRFDPVSGKPITTQLDAAAAPSANWVSFAEDNEGELYAVALNQGSIFKLASAAPAPPSTFPDRLSKTGCVDPAQPQKPAAGLVPYGVNAALWSDGATKERWLALPDGKQISVNATDGDFDIPTGSVIVKTFSVGGRRIETRLLMRHDDGNWGGYSYEWLDDQSDALLLPSSKTKAVGAQTWSFPSRSDCFSCHSEAAGRTLGLELGQQNGDFVYSTTNRKANQLKTLEHIGVFAQALGKPVTELPSYPPPFGDTALEPRARAYLHANCANCHRPQGGGLGDMDLRFSTPFADTKTCAVEPRQGGLGVASAKLVSPGSAAKSVLPLRVHAVGAGRMPPLGSSVEDGQGAALLDAWINAIPACP